MITKSYVGFVYSRSSCHGQRTHAMGKHLIVKKFRGKFTIKFRRDNKQYSRNSNNKKGKSYNSQRQFMSKTYNPTRKAQ